MYSGEELERKIAEFLRILDAGATVYKFPDAVIVLEAYGFKGNWRAWLLVKKFRAGTIRAMKQVAEGFKGDALYASTHDGRIRKHLLSFGFVEYYRQTLPDFTDYYLVLRRKI